MGIHKNNKIAKTIRWQHRGGTQNITKNQVKRSSSLMTRSFKSQTRRLAQRARRTIKIKLIWGTWHLLIFHKKYIIHGPGCPSRWCHTLAEVERHVDEKTWGNDVVDTLDKTYRPSLLWQKRSTFFVMRSLTKNRKEWN
jgi:hypothetical protein